jgi:hypothetical protein
MLPAIRVEAGVGRIEKSALAARQIQGTTDQATFRPRIRSGAGYSGESRNPEESWHWTPAFAGVTAFLEIPGKYRKRENSRQ